MKKILVVGAGQSSPYLIAYLLEHAEAEDWWVTVADLDPGQAARRVGEHPRGRSIAFDIEDEAQRDREISEADVVVNMLSPSFQNLIAWDCVSHGRHMVSASYRERAVRHLGRDAERKGVLLLCEMGLDPGIDHMSAMALITRLHAKGGRIVTFRSYGSGIPAPGQPHNPLRYVITWNPRNVAMAGSAGAQYMEEGRIKIVPYHQVFHHTWNVEVDGIGTLEAYPNRDSLSYMQSFGLEHVRTMIRGTLRYPGWSETWAQIVRLGLPNEQVRIPNLAERTYREVLEMFLPLNVEGVRIEQRLGRYLQISPTGRIMENLRWLGLLSDEKTGCHGNTAAALLTDLLVQRLPLLDTDRDLACLVHELEVEYPGTDRRPERITSTLVTEGVAGRYTAMSKTVGLPAAVAVRLLLRGELSLRGSHIPTVPEVYEPVLRELQRDGLEFREKVETIG